MMRNLANLVTLLTYTHGTVKCYTKGTVEFTYVCNLCVLLNTTVSLNHVYSDKHGTDATDEWCIHIYMYLLILCCQIMATLFPSCYLHISRIIQVNINPTVYQCIPQLATPSGIYHEVRLWHTMLSNVLWWDNQF